MPSSPLPRRVFLLMSGLTATAAVPRDVVAQQAAPENGSNVSDPTDRSETTGNETETGSENTTAGFEPAIDVDCYVASVDAESYDSVEIDFADGTTATFDDGYSGRTQFGFDGDGRIETDSPMAVEEFSGPIEQVTVTAGTASETVDHETDACAFADLTFECTRVRYSRGDDVRVSFADGSVKRWDPPAGDQSSFGSPGRVIETITEGGVDVEVRNPDSDCEPGEYATVFECTEVTIGESEFAAEPTFDRMELQFTDGSTQAFGDQSTAPNFRAPETFAGTDDHEGKIIESVVVTKGGGDVSFRLVNPAVDDCEPTAAVGDEGAQSDVDGASASGAEQDAPTSAVSDESDRAVSGERGEGNEGETLKQVSEMASETVDQMPWWGWMTAIGGAGGVGSYLVGRTLGDEPPEAESTETASMAIDEPTTKPVDGEEYESWPDDAHSRWENFGDR